MPSKEETEELERALAAVSKDVNSVKESLEKLSSVQIEEALGLSEAGLLSGTDHLTNTIDVQTLSNHLVAAATPHNSGLEMLNGQFSHNDLTSISQALSTMGSDNYSIAHSQQQQQQMCLPNGLGSNSLLVTSDLQHLQTQYLHQAPVSSTVCHFSTDNQPQMPTAYSMNGIVDAASQQWLTPAPQQHLFSQNGFVFSNQQPVDSISSNAKFSMNPVEAARLPSVVVKQAMMATPSAGADSFHSVNNSTLETVSQQQSTPAS